MINHFFISRAPERVVGSVMNISVNGEARAVPAPLTIAALLESLGVAGKRVAVEVNREIVPKSRHAEFKIQESDRVEVVFAIGGG